MSELERAMRQGTRKEECLKIAFWRLQLKHNVEAQRSFEDDAAARALYT